MTIPTVNLNFFSDPVPFYCPACGRKIYADEALQQPCQHVVFTGESLTGNWSWHTVPLNKRFKENMQRRYTESAAAQTYPSFTNYLANLHIDTAVAIACEIMISSSAFLLSITTSDRGCGGMCHGTLYLIIDFDPA